MYTQKKKCTRSAKKSDKDPLHVRSVQESEKWPDKESEAQTHKTIFASTPPNRLRRLLAKDCCCCRNKLSAIE